jgi:hypothetical protein
VPTRPLSLGLELVVTGCNLHVAALPAIVFRRDSKDRTSGTKVATHSFILPQESKIVFLVFGIRRSTPSRLLCSQPLYRGNVGSGTGALRNREWLRWRRRSMLSKGNLALRHMMV